MESECLLPMNENVTVTLLRSKLHRIRVTEANLRYVGSLTVDQDLMDAAGLFPNEKILCANCNNGERFETYVIPGRRGSKVCCLNGAASHKGKVGDVMIVMAFAQVPISAAGSFCPKVVFLKDGNVASPVPET